MRSSAIFLVSVVTSTRWSSSARTRISPTRSSIWPLVGRTTISGSIRPGRAARSARRPAWRPRSRTALGVADRNTTWLTFSMNSSNRSGRLSIADGSRNPCSTSVSLRDRSPSYWPWSCGTVCVRLVDAPRGSRRGSSRAACTASGRRRGRRGGASSSRCRSTRRSRASSRGRRWCACAAAAPRAACRAPRTTRAARPAPPRCPRWRACMCSSVGDVVRRREQHEPVELLDDLAGERVDRRDALDLVAEELDPDRPLLVGREHLDGVAAHPELVAGERRSRCARTAARRAGRGSRAGRAPPPRRGSGTAARTPRDAEAVDRRHRRHDDHVAPRTSARWWPSGAAGRSRR